MPTKMKARLQVRSYEVDSFGHVNNAIFLNYLEFARGEFLRQKGLSFNDFIKWKAFPYVAKIIIEYKTPAKFDDILEVSGWISHFSRASFTLNKEIINIKTGKLLARAEVTMVFVNDNQRPTAIPREFREKFSI